MSSEQGAVAATSETSKPPKKKGYVTFKRSTVVLVGVLVLFAAKCHVVYGGGVGLTVCEKDGWALSDTFVDLDDYVGKPLISLLPKAQVVRAMFACGTLEKPEFVKEREASQ